MFLIGDIMGNLFFGCGVRYLGSFNREGILMTVISILMMLTGVFYFAVYMKKRKNNKQKEIGYKIVFAVVFFLLSVSLINFVITGG